VYESPELPVMWLGELDDVSQAFIHTEIIETIVVLLAHFIDMLSCILIFQTLLN